MPIPLLELTISRQNAENTQIAEDAHESADAYTVEARLYDLNKVADNELTKTSIKLDTRMLFESVNDPDNYGHLLTNMIFNTVAMRMAWGEVKKDTAGTGVYLRIRLRLDSTAKNLHSLHWEALCDPDNYAPMATSQRMLFSRYLDSPSWNSPNLPTQPDHLRVLVVVANPTDLVTHSLSPIDSASQVDSIAQALGPTIPLTIIGNTQRATLSNICDAMTKKHYHILYLVCHGTYKDQDTHFWLEDEDGKNQRISSTELSEVLTQQKYPPLLIILAACNSAGSKHDFGATSAIGPRLAAAGIVAVLAMQDNVSQSINSQHARAEYQE